MDGIRLNPELWELVLEGLSFKNRYHAMLVCKAWYESLGKPGRAYVDGKLKRKREKEPFLHRTRMKGMENYRGRTILKGLGMVEVARLQCFWEVSITTARGHVYAYAWKRYADDEDAEDCMVVRFTGEKVLFDEWLGHPSNLLVEIEHEEDDGYDARSLGHEVDFLLKGYDIKGFHIQVPLVHEKDARSALVKGELDPIHKICENIGNMGIK